MGTTNLPLTFDQRVLAAHNRERLDLGLEPFSWNPALAHSAQNWADYLASTGQFKIDEEREGDAVVAFSLP